MAGMWEFPGGKNEEGESIKETIFRELLEELAIEVEVKTKIIEFDHSYSHKTLHFVVYICDLISGEPKPLESSQIKWVSINDLKNYAFPAANHKIIKSLQEYLHSRS